MNSPIMEVLVTREMERGSYAKKEPGKKIASLEHWHLSLDQNDIAWLIFDKKDASANVLSAAVLDELRELVQTLENEKPRGLALRSVKKTGFCMGADIHEFSALTTESQVIDKLSDAHAVVSRFEALPFPKVAIIHGNCLGGGLELALCCDYRLAIPGAKLGFPEVQLGLHPGLGGTARLSRLIDPIQAMTMMLTGKPAPAEKAKKLGLVDDIVHERHVLTALAAMVEGKVKHSSHWLREQLLTNKPARMLETRQMRSQSAKKAPPEHYPAPEALIQLWEDHGGSHKSMLRAEIVSFAQLLTSEASRSLVRLFNLRGKMKELTRTQAEPVRHVHIIGAGEMGGDIAGWCAFKGLQVSLFDKNPKKLSGAVKKLNQLCQRKHLSEAEQRAVQDRLMPDFANQGLGHADLVIEAVPENATIKHKVYQEAEPQLKEGALLATNTSSIPLQQLKEQLEDPSRLVGLHFFNPVAMMPLVEVVRHDDISDQTYDRARTFVGQIDRLVAPVATAPGFLVNRALTPYLIEAMIMRDEGIQAEAIDRVAEQFGMPMGPIELADQVGLDVCLSVADMLLERLDSPIPAVPDWFRSKVEEGNLGRKTGEGMYHWSDNQPEKKQRVAKAPQDTLERLLLPMLNACMGCLRQGVIDNEELVDGAMVFGTGFAPFRGGPLHYAHSRGFDQIHQQLETLTQRYGERFRPDPGWKQH
ncbi:MAG: fatty-acid oxidation protein subunit alpha [Halomonadaceae bacterium]|nr:MAG: fatty-acid oxidation protein subunit alpha [Halomonadaceae bacterium]